MGDYKKEKVVINFLRFCLYQEKPRHTIMIRKNKELDVSDIYPTPEELKEWGFKGLQPINAYDRDILYEHEYPASRLERLKKECVDPIFANVSSSIQGVLRVCTFNVHNFLNICHKEKIKKQFDSYFSFFQKLDATILCLQEVVPLHTPPLEKDAHTREEITKASFQPLIEQMKSLGYTYYLLGDAMRGTNVFPEQKYYVLCNAIFSKLPFLRQSIYRLPGNRNFLSVGVEYEKKEYLVINTHLDVHNTVVQGKEVGLAEIQAKILQQYIQSYRNQYAVTNVLLCGDLNRPYELKGTLRIKRSKDIERIFAPLYPLLQEPRYQEEYLFTNLSIQTQTDYILVSKDFSDTIMDYYVIPYFISDHHPLVLEILPPTGFSEQRNLIELRKKFPKTLNVTLQNLPIYWLQPEGYTNPEQAPLYDDIQEKDTLTPIQRLATYYKNTYFSTLAERKPSSPLDTEYVMFQYVKCRPHMKLVTFFPAFSGKIEQKKVAYSKTLLLTRKEAMGVLYQMYKASKTCLELEREVVQKGWETNEAREIHVVWYEEFTPTSTDTFYVTESFGSMIDLSSLYLNENSLRMLKYQDLENLEKCNKKNHGASFVMFNTVKRIFQEKFSLLDRERCIVVSSTVLYAYGLRNMNDIDAYIYYYPRPSKEFRETLYTYTLEPGKMRKDELSWFDGYLAQTEEESYYDSWYDKVSLAMKDVRMKDVIFDPRYHFYFCGQKCSLLLFEVIKRLYRFKPKSWADLIAINVKYHQGIKLPLLPEKIKHYYKESIDPKTLVNTISHNLRIQYGIQMKPEIIQTYFTLATLSPDVNEYDIEKNRDAFENYLLKDFHLE